MYGFLDSQVPATWSDATAGIRRLASPERRWSLPPGTVAAHFVFDLRPDPVVTLDAVGDADIEAVAATPADDVGIEALLAAEHHRLGRAALSDHPRLARGHGVPRHEFVTRSAGGAVSGFAIAVAANDTSIVETASPDPTARRALLRAVVEHVPGPLQWWAHHATDTDRALAADLGGRPNRILLQMRRPLPADEPRRDPGLRWTTMAPGDEAALIAVNNRAFADHDEQGGWTAETFAERGSEPWFDPAGIVEVFADDRLAGFCWTKIHPPQGDDPELGEIYVVGVDPDFQGRGLGAALTLAGLASMAERGVGVGMLYVDADNTAAVAMYDRLGFVTVRQDQSFVWGS